jgi:hypothetical protein
MVMEQRRPQVVIKCPGDYWHGKTGEIRAWLDETHAMIDLEEPGLRASLRYHKREFKEARE